MFKNNNTNVKDGFLNRKETANILQILSQGKSTDKEVDKLFGDLYKDNNGNITLEEFKPLARDIFQSFQKMHIDRAKEAESK